MKRREFIGKSAFALAASPLLGSTSLAAGQKLDRIACTTVAFRLRFPATQPRTGFTPTEPNLELLDVPAMFAGELGLTNVEIWSKHFTAKTIGYAEKLRAAADLAGTKIINIQMDEPPFDLSSPDPAKRAACIDITRTWMDLAAACGAPSLRANTGGRRNETFDLATTADSFRQLAAYGEERGVRILVENHGGHSVKPENVAAIVRTVNSPWCRTLPDFGNMPRDFTTEQRLEFLGHILPDAWMTSAKGMVFDANYVHITYDFAACVRAAEASGFTGIHSIELWAPDYVAPEPARAVQSLIRLIEANI